MQIASAAADTVALAVEIAECGDPDHHADASAACDLAAGALAAAAGLVRVNLAVGSDTSRRSRLAEMETQVGEGLARAQAVVPN